MSEFFKELLNHVKNIWKSLTMQQRVLVSSVFGFTVLGLLLILIIPVVSSRPDRTMTYLYNNLPVEDVIAITQRLDASEFHYNLGPDGRSILVERENVHRVKMFLAKEGLPTEATFVGYEIFDKQNFGVTDFQQRVNYRRAIEGELARTISSMEEIEVARVHIVEAKRSLFKDEEEDAKASVTLKLSPGASLDQKQVRGIVYLISSAVQGLNPVGVTVVDMHGNLLTNPYQKSDVANLSSFQQELTLNVGRTLENKAQSLLDGMLGSGKSHVRVAVELNFEKLERTEEVFNPDGGVIRSREDNREATVAGEEQSTTERDNRIVNYEIDRTVSHIVGETGNIRRMTVSVAVDGIYREVDGQIEYTERGEEELERIEALVRNALGFNEDRADNIVVANVQFDRSYLEQEIAEIEQVVQHDRMLEMLRWVVIAFVILIGALMIRGVVKSIINAVVMEKPKFSQIGSIDEIIEDDAGGIEGTKAVLDNIEAFLEKDLDVLISAIRVMMKAK